MNAIASFKPQKHQDGFWQQLGMPARGERLYQALEQGLSFDIYDRLAKLSGVDKSTIAQSAVIAPATLRRRAKSGLFNKQESDRLYRFAEVYKAALDLFEGDGDATRTWLTTANRGLGQKRPLDMLATMAESEAVINLIGRMEHGVFA